MAAMFCLLMANLFVLRFKSGDIYPPYSSFRADPLGTKALFESISQIKTLSAERNFSPSNTILKPELTCLIAPGIGSGSHLYITQKEYENIDWLANSGCRLIIGLTPRIHSQSKTGKKDSENDDKQDSEAREDASKIDKPDTQDINQDTDQEAKRVDLFKKLGIQVKRTQIKEKEQYALPSEQMRAKHRMLPTPWQQGVWFNTISPGWKTRYSLQFKEPVIIEKQFKKGSIVLLADSYIFSNESLKKGGTSPILAWLMGDKPRIVFDEYHLGVQKQPGISSLIKKYRLYGPITLFILFAGLLVWKQSSCLVPPDEQNELDRLTGEGNDKLQTKDHTSGLTSLLKQHIPKNNLISQCVDAWRSTFVLDNQASQKFARQYEKIQSTLADAFDNKKQSLSMIQRPRQIMDEYIRICHILSEKEKS